mmetsp:Transcript_16391/g.38912  ORF Transcript_16391/g.38912 Transcript_16391/m.38912 type:complete len:221 (+) Transcript_16391:808-1470(+)
MAEGSTPTARAAVAAQAAFCATCGPMPGTSTSSTAPPPRLSAKPVLGPGGPHRVCGLPSSRTSARGDAPNRQMRAPRGTRMRSTRGSSALSTTASSRVAPKRISALAAATSSSEPPTPARCASATQVTTLTEGRHIPARREISPRALIPSSSTRASAPLGVASRVRGRPTPLFMLPPVAWTEKRPPSTLATISFTVVLPQLPVIPTTGPWKLLRTKAARR